MEKKQQKSGRYLRPARKKPHYKRALLLLLSVLLLLTATFGGTLAYIAANTSRLINQFEPGEVACSVQETFADNTKTEVAVKNTGNTSAYIRVKLLPYYYDEEKDIIVAKSAWTPSFTVGSSWTKGEDGYYYHLEPVQPGQTTSVLIESITLERDDVTLARQVLEIIASCIQAEPADAVTEAWSGANGSVTGVSGSTLTVIGG